MIDRFFSSQSIGNERDELFAVAASVMVIIHMMMRQRERWVSRTTQEPNR